MSWRGPLVLVAVMAAVSGSSLFCGCSASNDGSASSGVDDVANDAMPRGAAQPWEVDPYSRTEEIFVDGEPVGYLVSYDAIPDGLVLERAMPAGSARIQDREFEDVGFVSPRGLFFRHAAKGAEALGYHPLDEGLRLFFGGGRQLKLAALAPSAPKATAAPAEGSAELAEEGAEGGDEEDGEG